MRESEREIVGGSSPPHPEVSRTLHWAWPDEHAHAAHFAASAENRLKGGRIT